MKKLFWDQSSGRWDQNREVSCPVGSKMNFTPNIVPDLILSLENHGLDPNVEIVPK